jgi:heme-degrading monooxygenase HmoA
MVRLIVANYARWKLDFDAHGTNRQASGSKGGQVFRSADDPSEVVVLFAWDPQKAHQFSRGEEFRARMQDAEVLGLPEIFLLEEIEQLSR